MVQKVLNPDADFLDNMYPDQEPPEPPDLDAWNIRILIQDHFSTTYIRIRTFLNHLDPDQGPLTIQIRIQNLSKPSGS